MAIIQNCTHLVTDISFNSCAPSQIREQLLYPESQRKRIHAHLPEQVASTFEKSHTLAHALKFNAAHAWK